MKGYIQVYTESGEVLVDREFYSRVHYMSLLAELVEIFTEHRIEITFESKV